MMNDLTMLMLIASMSEEGQAIQAIIAYVKGIDMSVWGFIGIVLTIVAPMATLNGLFGFVERITGKKIARQDKQNEQDKVDKQHTLPALAEESPFPSYPSSVILAMIAYAQIEAIEKMEVIFVTKEGTRFPLYVEGISSIVMHINFGYIEEAQAIEYIRLEQVLYTSGELTGTIEIGQKRS